MKNIDMLRYEDVRLGNNTLLKWRVSQQILNSDFKMWNQTSSKEPESFIVD